MNEYEAIDLKQIVFDELHKKTEAAQKNDFVNNIYKEESERLSAYSKDELIKVVMMSDLHMDWDYLPGADNSCGKPLCCRSDSGMAPTAARAAGKWGDFNCDLNRLTLDNMLSEIKNNVKPDLVLWAGDSVPHNIDTLTFESNVNIMKNITKEVSEGLDGIKVIPCIGNHDTYPQDIIKMKIPRENAAI